MLNKFGPSGHGEAQEQYLDGDFRVVSAGTYVRSAITDVRIPLDELKYWSVDLSVLSIVGIHGSSPSGRWSATTASLSCDAENARDRTGGLFPR